MVAAVDVADFDFALPDELIAQEPSPERGGSRLLVLDRATGAIEHAMFKDIVHVLKAGDLLVVNDTRVFPARLIGHRVPSGGVVECLLVRKLPTPNGFASPTPKGQLPTPNGFASPTPKEELPTPNGVDRPTPKEELPTPNGFASPTPNRELPTSNDFASPTHTLVDPAGAPLGVGRAKRLGVGSFEEKLGVGSFEEWEALMHPGQKLKPGALVVFEHEGVRIQGEVLERRFFGRRTVRLTSDDRPLAEAINRIGHIPLPPYIRRDDRPDDRERYQTVYAQERGSIAAPTAGLHFTESLLRALTDRGVELGSVTLHVGYGTFKPVRVARVEEHTVDPEPFTVGVSTADALTRARREGRRVIAVGTTTVRALESLETAADGQVLPQTGNATLFIHPGYQFRIVQGLVTNFHLPKSSLLMLVAAFAGREPVMHAYGEAVRERYRFYSYGDAMVIV